MDGIITDNCEGREKVTVWEGEKGFDAIDALLTML